MTGTMTVEGTDVSVCLDLSAADRWHMLVLDDGRPAARIDLASPGASVSGALLSAAVLRWADWAMARDELVKRLGARLDLPRSVDAPSPVRCSVVVCTRRRPTDLSRLLRFLGDLDPAPIEVIVVDNDPGECDCRAVVLAAGARYVREDRRGLNNARNAGIRQARGDLVAFVDDDCVTSRGWLARLPAEFVNPAVGAVTGPAFPYILDTPSRRRMERQASLARGLRRLEFDWTTFPVTGAGALGVGANMIFRRAVLLTLGAEPFPPELDAGTATESGGDTYVIARLLALGHRVVYDPATFVYHCHRADARALHRAFFGYGVGLGAALTRLLVEDREMSTPATWMWLVSQYLRTQQRRFAGQADRVETRLAWDFLRGGMLGPARWRRALKQVTPVDSETLRASASFQESSLSREMDQVASSAELDTQADTPAVSVIIPTHERPHALARCLDALARQDVGVDRFEVIVVDDSSSMCTSIDAIYEQRLRLRAIRTGGRGAAEARNAGAALAVAPILLFLDDDIIARPELLRRHLERHAGEFEEVIVVGSYPPRPVESSLASAAAALWWNDLFHAMQRSATPTYVGVLTGNMSISKLGFERSGCFDPRFGRYRREDWEWGLRALKAGLSLRYESAAQGHHEYALATSGRLAAAELEGHGDVLLLRDHPDAGSAVIPLVAEAPSTVDAVRLLKRSVWRSSSARAVVSAILAMLERAKLRLLWVRLFNMAQWLSYERGVQRAGMSSDVRFEESLVDLDLDGIDAIPSPSVVAPTLRVRVGGVEVARVRPALGQWTSDLAEQIVAEVPWPAVEQAAASSGCFPSRDETHDHISHTHVIFGPAHGLGDTDDRTRLISAGATVSMLDGADGEHWMRVAEAARSGGPALVAVTMPGIGSDPRWLDEALVAFDGARVGVVLGRGLADGMPVAPLVLHSRSIEARDPQLDAALAPHYVVFRRELFPALTAGLAMSGLLAPALALAEDALEGGWVVGYRDVHGLRGGGAPGFDGGRVRAALRIGRSRAPAALVRAELRQSTALMVWNFIRRHERRMAVGVYAGTLVGLCCSLSPHRWRRSIG